MSNVIICSFCGQPFPDNQTRCPHCARPSLFPNVSAANRLEERNALDARYSQACQDLSARGCDVARQQFETEIQNTAVVVLSTSFNELERMAAADANAFSTNYFTRVKAGEVIPKGDKWDVLRGVAEHALFPGYKEDIRFAALSLDRAGVRNYGQCAITLKTGMVCHRASLFEDNNVVFTVFEQKATMADAENLEKGHRAAWPERAKLCLAKLAPKLHAGLTANDFPAILLEQGKTSSDDHFVEVHIWGSLTVRSVESVRVFRKGNTPRAVIIKDVQRQLKTYNVPLDTKG